MVGKGSGYARLVFTLPLHSNVDPEQCYRKIERKKRRHFDPSIVFELPQRDLAATNLWELY